MLVFAWLLYLSKVLLHGKIGLTLVKMEKMCFCTNEQRGQCIILFTYLKFIQFCSFYLYVGWG